MDQIDPYNLGEIHNGANFSDLSSVFKKHLCASDPTTLRGRWSFNDFRGLGRGSDGGSDGPILGFFVYRLAVFWGLL
jgi:hypothetical protein